MLFVLCTLLPLCFQPDHIYTLKLRVSSAYVPVIAEVVLSAEALAAHVAGVGPLVRVRTLVDQ